MESIRPPNHPKFPFRLDHNGRAGEISFWKKTKKFGTYFRFAGKAYRNSFSTFEAAHQYLHREFSTVDTNRANSLALYPINHDVKVYHELEQDLRDRGNGVTLREVVEFYFVYHEHKRFSPRTVSECIKSFLKHEIANNVSPSHAKTLKRHLKQFERAFGSTPIHKISKEQISDWLTTFRSKNGNPWGATTKRHIRGSLVSLSIYAKSIHALPDLGKTEFQHVKRPRLPEKGEVEIYSPSEISRLLETAVTHDIDLIPGIVFGCFQGLRPDEFHGENAKQRKPLCWEAINWQDATLQVRGRKIRSHGTRPFPFQKVSQAWLEPFRMLKGPIWRYTKAYDDKMKSLFAKAGLDRRYDAFRHSYASYRIRHLNQSLDLLASEMGNSPREIVNSYKFNVSDAEADAWFSVMPPPGYGKRIEEALTLRQAA